MTNFGKGRLVVYILGILAGLAAASGYGTYDFETGDFDLHPFNVQEVGTLIVMGLGNVAAAVALWRGWKP
jgi:hypothetical protein